MPATFMWVVPHGLLPFEDARAVAEAFLKVLAKKGEISSLVEKNIPNGHSFQFMRKEFLFEGKVSVGRYSINCYGIYPKSGLYRCSDTRKLFEDTIHKLCMEMSGKKAA